MRNNEHTIILVAGRTASGKDSLVNTVCDRTGATQLISYTTRPRRTNEGNTHNFVTEDDYQAFVTNNQIAAFTQIGQYKYWCTIDQLYKSDFYVIDPAGIKTLMALDLPNLRFVIVYIHVPDEERQRRALEVRKDDKAAFRTRDFNERNQFREFERNLDFAYSIKNLDFAKSYSCLRWIATIERALTKQTN